MSIFTKPVDKHVDYTNILNISIQVYDSHGLLGVHYTFYPFEIVRHLLEDVCAVAVGYAVA